MYGIGFKAGKTKLIVGAGLVSDREMEGIMKSVRLFKILQRHAAVINGLALDVYNEKREADEALDLAKTEIKKVEGELEEK